ncbi:MAG: hypothetical protein AAF304_07955 [Pseudomonadota bacterium]
MREEIVQIICESLTDINEELDYDSLKNATESTEIYGGDDGIDSLSLVRLVTDVEMKINEKFDSNVLLASEKAMSMRNSPYRSVSNLADFAMGELEGNS